MPCTCWAEHEWTRVTFVETGRHLTMGAYTRWLVVCQRCEARTMETEWRELPVDRRENVLTKTE